MLLRFDPFRELDRLATRGPLDAGSSLPMDAVRRGDTVEVSLDLPGADPDSIEVLVERDLLTVRAERQAPATGEGDVVLAAERSHGRVTRRLILGEVLDGDRVEADYDRGVLVLRIPVAQRAKPRKVAVSVGEKSGDYNPAIEVSGRDTEPVDANA